MSRLIQPYGPAFATGGGGGGATGAASFGGGVSYLSRNSLLTGVTDSASYTLAFWLRIPSFAAMAGLASPACFSFADPGQPVFEIQLAPNGTFDGAIGIACLDSPAGATADYVITNTFLLENTWQMIMISENVAFAAASRVRSLYYGDTAMTIVDDFSNGNSFLINFADATLESISLNVERAGFTDPSPADYCQFLLWTGLYTDFSNATNRRLFYSATGTSVNAATAIAALGTPNVAFYGDSAAFPTNAGSGGSFALTGSVSNATPIP